MTALADPGSRDLARRMVRRVILGVRRRMVVDVGLGVGRAVVVAGSARSGTTWVADRIAAALGARVVFEPFIVDDRGRPASLQPRPWSEAATRRSVSRYLREGASGDPWDAAVSRILAGRVPRLWRDRTRPGLYRRRVVKAVRGNLMLGHLASRWPRLPILWLVRDPVAVVGSQVRLAREGWDFDWSPGCALDQPNLMSDWLAPFERSIRDCGDLVDRLALRWCIENYVPLRQDLVARGVVRLDYGSLCGSDDAWRNASARLVAAGLARRGAPGRDGVLAGLRGDQPPEAGRGAAGVLSAEQERRVWRRVEAFGLVELATAAAATRGWRRRSPLDE